MSSILLSFCIPTFNRPERIDLFLKQFSSIISEEIEIIIGDDNPLSLRTTKIVAKYNNSKIRYFHNKKNLSLDGNLLKLIHKAKGEFVFINMDDDDIEMNEIPWILEVLKKTENLAQIRGSIGIKKLNKTYGHYDFKDEILNKGEESIIQMAFSYAHCSGVILKKEFLDLNQAKQFIGTNFIQELLMVQAMLKGDTLLTSKKLAYIGELYYESQHPPLVKNRKHYHPVGGLIITRLRIQIILKLLKGDLKKRLLTREIKNIYIWLFRTLFNPFQSFESIKAFLDGLAVICTIKDVNKSIKFWFELLYQLIFKIIKSPRFKKKRF